MVLAWMLGMHMGNDKARGHGLVRTLARCEREHREASRSRRTPYGGPALQKDDNSFAMPVATVRTLLDFAASNGP